MSWHADHDTLDAYTAVRLDPVRAASLEAHVVACSLCRAALAERSDVGRLTEVRDRLFDGLDAPAPGVLERFLHRVGLPESDARLVAVTPALRSSWIVAVLSVLAFGVLAAHVDQTRGLWLFLVTAPVLPVAGVATAYGPRVDPTHETTVATPTDGFRLLLLRGAAVLAATLLAAGAAAVALPTVDATVVAWLLPAAALTSVSLALGTYVPPVWAAAGVVLVWVATTGSVAAQRSAPAVLAGAPVQLTCMVVAALAASVVVVRRWTYATARTR